jgi:hypothetical protein
VKADGEHRDDPHPQHDDQPDPQHD